ncbi:hypothetical protein MKW92_031341, partial [Papaver armeniacum]
VLGASNSDVDSEDSLEQMIQKRNVEDEEDEKMEAKTFQWHQSAAMAILKSEQNKVKHRRSTDRQRKGTPQGKAQRQEEGPS